MSRWNREGCPTNPMDIVEPFSMWSGAAAKAPQQGQQESVPVPRAGTHLSGGVSKVVELAGPLADYGRCPELEHYEQVFRVLPNDSWFSVDRAPNNPTQFEIGAFTSDKGRMIFIFDYSVRPFTFSGVTTTDYTPLDEGELGGAFGYSIQLGGRPPGVVRYRIDAVSSTINRAKFGFNKQGLSKVARVTPADFERVRAESFGAATGFGGNIHPQAPGRFGARNVPFMLPLTDDLAFSITGVIFRQISIPLAFIEARVSGYITDAQSGKKLLEELTLSLPR